MPIPAILPGLLALGSTVGGAIAGGSAAAAQAREAARREKYNQMMDALNTRFRVFGGAGTHKLAETAAGPGAGTGAFLGGMGGLQTGLNLYSGLKDLGSAKTFTNAAQGAAPSPYGGLGVDTSFKSDMNWLDPTINPYKGFGG